MKCEKLTKYSEQYCKHDEFSSIRKFMKMTNIEFNVIEFWWNSCEKSLTNKICEKYCTSIVILYMSVPTTFMSLVLSDLFWILSLQKYNLLLLLLFYSFYSFYSLYSTPRTPRKDTKDTKNIKVGDQGHQGRTPRTPRKNTRTPRKDTKDTKEGHQGHQGHQEPYRTLLNLIESYWTLLNLIGPYWTLLNLIEPYWTS